MTYFFDYLILKNDHAGNRMKKVIRNADTDSLKKNT